MSWKRDVDFFYFDLFIFLFYFLLNVWKKIHAETIFVREFIKFSFSAWMRNSGKHDKITSKLCLRIYFKISRRIAENVHGERIASLVGPSYKDQFLNVSSTSGLVTLWLWRFKCRKQFLNKYFITHLCLIQQDKRQKGHYFVAPANTLQFVEVRKILFGKIVNIIQIISNLYEPLKYLKLG